MDGTAIYIGWFFPAVINKVSIFKVQLFTFFLGVQTSKRAWDRQNPTRNGWLSSVHFTLLCFFVQIFLEVARFCCNTRCFQRSVMFNNCFPECFQVGNLVLRWHVFFTCSKGLKISGSGISVSTLVYKITGTNLLTCDHVPYKHVALVTQWWHPAIIFFFKAAYNDLLYWLTRFFFRS